MSGLCAAVLELKKYITHTEVKDYKMCSAGRMSFCLCDVCQPYSQTVIGASLSKPHTNESNGAIFIYLPYVVP